MNSNYPDRQQNPNEQLPEASESAYNPTPADPSVPPAPSKPGSDNPWRIFAAVGLVVGIVSFVSMFFILLSEIISFAAVIGRTASGSVMDIVYFSTLQTSGSIHGIVFSALGKKSKTAHGKATTGLVLSIIAAAVTITSVFFFIFLLIFSAPTQSTAFGFI